MQWSIRRTGSRPGTLLAEVACPSGLRSTPRKRVWVKVHRGFKSHRYRQSKGPTRSVLLTWGPSSFPPRSATSDTPPRKIGDDGDRYRVVRAPGKWLSAHGSARRRRATSGDRPVVRARRTSRRLQWRERLSGACGCRVPSGSLRALHHCGLHELRTDDGHFFERVGGPLTDGSGNPPHGWGNPIQSGQLVVTEELAVFTDDLSHREEFRLREGATDFLQICS